MTSGAPNNGRYHLLLQCSITPIKRVIKPDGPLRVVALDLGAKVNVEERVAIGRSSLMMEMKTICDA